MQDVKLEERLSELRGRDVQEQVSSAVGIILDSPNGVYRKVFDFYIGRMPAAAKLLAERIDQDTGILRKGFFGLKVGYELMSREVLLKKGEVVTGTYVLFVPGNVENAKDYLKTNEVAPTRLIGAVDGAVAAFLDCDSETAQKVMSRGSGTHILVPYQGQASFAELHEAAVMELLPKLEQEMLGLKCNIGLFWQNGRGARCQVDRYNQLMTAYDLLATSMGGKFVHMWFRDPPKAESPS